MKATILTVPRYIFVPLNRNGSAKIEPKFFKAKFLKRPYARLNTFVSKA